MRRSLFLAVLAIFLFAFVQNASAASYKKFTSKAGRFSVWTPVPLREVALNEFTLAGNIPLHMFVSTPGDWGYMVGYCDYPKSVLRQGRQKMLDMDLMGALIWTRSRLKSKEAIELEGYPGEEFVMDKEMAKGKVMTVKGRIFLARARLYMIIAGAGKGEMSTREMDEFIDSLDLLSR